MGTHLRPRHDRAYWDGVRDGIAEVTEHFTKMINEGLMEAEQQKSPTDIGLISRERVVKLLQSMARQMEGVAAKVAEVVDSKEDTHDGNDDEGEADQG